MIKPLAFTSIAPKGMRFSTIITKIGVRQSRIQSSDNKSNKYEAIWDTGATSTCINHKIQKELSLKVVDKRLVGTANGKTLADFCMVDMILPNGVMISNITVAVLDVSGGDILIGMNLICLGDFSITNANDTTCVSFRTPPKNVHINYWHEIKYGKPWNK